MALGSKRFLTVEWDRKDLRMAMVRPKGDRVELLKAVSVPLPSDLALDNAEMIGAFIREAMRQSGISARHAVMAVPRDLVPVLTLTLPPTPANDLPALIQFQVVKELPFSADQATIDFAIAAGHDPKSQCVALVGAVRNDDLAFYKQVAQEAGLTLERIGLRPYANFRAVMDSDPELNGRTVLAIDVGPVHTEINVITGGSLVFSRAALLPLPNLDLPPTDKALDSRIASMPVLEAEQDEVSRETVGKLMVEIIRTYESFRANSPSINIDQIVVCGATGLEPELSQSLAARFAARAKLFMPDRPLDLSQQRAKELRGFSATLGLAIGHGRPAIESFDFLKPKKTVSKRARQLRKAPAAIMAAVLVLGVGFYFYVNKVRPEQSAMDRALQKLQKRQMIKKPYEEFGKESESLEAWKKSEQRWPEVLVAITEAFPPEEQACADRVEFSVHSVGRLASRESRLSMTMRVAESGVVNLLSEKLRELGFTKVDPRAETPRGVRGSESSNYRFDTKLVATLPSPSERKWQVPLADQPDAADSEDNAVAPASTDANATAMPNDAGVGAVVPAGQTAQGAPNQAGKPVTPAHQAAAATSSPPDAPPKQSPPNGAPPANAGNSRSNPRGVVSPVAPKTRLGARPAPRTGAQPKGGA